jgi:LysR family hydrogen peroxide-inducible transcriptional activator
MTPTLRQLRYLVALEDHRHFGRAADHCAVTQSTLSAGIKDLEDLLSVSLVDRGRRQTALTPAGLETAQRARKLLQDAEELVLAASAARVPLSGPLSLGVIPTIAPFLLPRILPGLRAAFPSLKLFLREDQTLRLIDLIDAGRLDAAILAFPYEHPAIESYELFSDPFLLCNKSGDPIEPPKLQDLDPADLLLLEDGHCLRDHVLTSCKLSTRGPVNGFQATSLYTLIHMVESGLGATLVPQMAIDAGFLEGLNVSAMHFADAKPERKIGIAWRRGTGRADEYRLLGQTLARLWTEPNKSVRSGS